MDTFSLRRISFQKEIVDHGILTSWQDSHGILVANYKDTLFDITVNDIHAVSLLKKLRIQLEEKGFLINCNGCRIDSSLRSSGIYFVYLLETGKPATLTNRVGIFEPTELLDKVCTLEQHDIGYTRWINS